MNAKRTIRKILFIGFWLCIGGGMLTLLLAAINKKNKGECRGYTITIRGGEKNRFIDNKDVEQLLLKTNGGKIQGRAVQSIDLNRMEQEIRKNVWISSAEIWFDNKDELHVNITEKEPLARIFTTEGTSFYIDSAANRLPLSDKLSARVPVFTGFTGKSQLGDKDSLLLNDIKQTADFILHDDFWMAQVSQIDITPERRFEMIPVVGNHVVKLGRGGDIKKKFRRLMVFYQQVLSKTGFDKYRTIDVQFEGQVVASRFDTRSGVDSAQLRRNVEKLLKGATDESAAELPEVAPGRYVIEADSTELNEEPPAPAAQPAKQPGNRAAGHDKPAPVKQPRAVMPARTHQ